MAAFLLLDTCCSFTIRNKIYGFIKAKHLQRAIGLTSPYSISLFTFSQQYKGENFSVSTEPILSTM
jgi:hypothetical protein